MSARAEWGKAEGETILGLTLWQPWAHVVVHHDKRIENRPWAPPKWAIGKTLAIHAGKKYDEQTAADLWTQFRISVPTKRNITLGAIVGTALLTGCVTESADRYFFGPFGWQLADVLALPEPIQCAGALGLWRLPPDVLARLLARAASVPKAPPDSLLPSSSVPPKV